MAKERRTGPRRGPVLNLLGKPTGATTVISAGFRQLLAQAPAARRPSEVFG